MRLIVDGTLVHARLNRHSTTLSILRALFRAIAQVPLGKRPARIEPRVVKRGPKPFPSMNRPPAKAGGFSDAPEGAQSAQGPTGTSTRGLRLRGLSNRQRTDGWKKEATRCARDYSDT